MISIYIRIFTKNGIKKEDSELDKTRWTFIFRGFSIWAKRVDWSLGLQIADLCSWEADCQLVIRLTVGWLPFQVFLRTALRAADVILYHQNAWGGGVLIHNCYLDTKENTSPFNIILAKVLLKKEDLTFETGRVRQL